MTFQGNPGQYVKEEEEEEGRGGRLGMTAQIIREVARLSLTVPSRCLLPVYLEEMRLRGWHHEQEAYTCRHLPRISYVSGDRRTDPATESTPVLLVPFEVI